MTGAGTGTITDSGMCVGQGTSSYTFGVTGDYFPNQGLSAEFGPTATPSDISWTDTCTDSTGRVYQQQQDTVIVPVVPLGAMFTNSTKIEGDCTPCFLVPPVHYVITANSQTSDSPLEAVNVNVDSPTEGITQSGLTVAAFRDTDASDTGSGFTATIDWGDHSTTSGGSIVSTSNHGIFNVTGIHLYKEAGKFSISVTVDDPDGSGITLTNQVTVQDADLKAKDNFAFSATPGVQFNGTTAVFYDSNPSAPASDFSITISWGDGAKSSGVAVRAGGSPGQAVFNITGTHTYTSPGTYPVEGMIVDKDSNIETANSTAYVGVSPLTTTSTASTASSSSGGGGGGIPEFPYQAFAASVFTALVAVSYLLVRRRVRAGPL
ncbi:MAG TPA: hypothetical protein VGR56_01280 [Nitrososphaerales archaeon]|nr:hypothetical protein [Nitrososphaerales archaeon]